MFSHDWDNTSAASLVQAKIVEGVVASPSFNSSGQMGMAKNLISRIICFYLKMGVITTPNLQASISSRVQGEWATGHYLSMIQKFQQNEEIMDGAWGELRESLFI